MNQKKITVQFEPLWKEYLNKRVEMLHYSMQEDRQINSQINETEQKLIDALSPEQIALFNEYNELLTAKECDFEDFLYEEAFRDAYRWWQFFQK